MQSRQMACSASVQQRELIPVTIASLREAETEANCEVLADQINFDQISRKILLRLVGLDSGD